MEPCQTTLHRTIHGFSALAGTVGFGLAQLPIPDAPVLITLQSKMVMVIAEIYGVRMTQASAAEFLLPFAATVAGRSLSRGLIGWVPGYGNALNAATAVALTEAIGWTAAEYFRGSK